VTQSSDANDPNLFPRPNPGRFKGRVGGDSGAKKGGCLGRGDRFGNFEGEPLVGSLVLSISSFGDKSVGEFSAVGSALLDIEKEELVRGKQGDKKHLKKFEKGR